MAKYQTLSKVFIAPNLLPEGTIFIIGDDYEPGAHLLPLDDAAKKAMAAWEKKAGITPIPDSPPGDVAEIEVVSIPGQPVEEVLDLASVQTEKAKPGPTEAGGKIAEAPKPLADPSPLPDTPPAPPPSKDGK